MLRLLLGIPFALLVAAPQQTDSQELLYLDLTGVQPRTELRRPPPPPPKCDTQGHCSMGGISSMSIGDCGVDIRDPRGLRVTLLQLDQNTARRGDRVGYELRIENIGKVPLPIPLSPHLADFQPADPTERFTVDEIGVGVLLRRKDGASQAGVLLLYSTADRPETAVEVQPGQSIRVRGTLRVNPEWWKDQASENLLLKAVPYINLSSSSFHLKTDGESREMMNKCIRLESPPAREFTLLASPLASN